MLRRTLSLLAAACVAVPLLSACQPTEPRGWDSPAAQLVNEAVYTWNDPAPAMAAFRLVALERGWNPADVEAWAPFTEAVMRRESGFCPNVLRGARIDVWEGCVIARQGPHSDAGFAQLISIHHRPGAWLCAQEGLCGKWEVIATPYASMTAFVALIERAGWSGWCYTASLRRGHVCQLAP